jgi:hypothetical protein
MSKHFVVLQEARLQVAKTDLVNMQGRDYAIARGRARNSGILPDASSRLSSLRTLAGRMPSRLNSQDGCVTFERI